MNGIRKQFKTIFFGCILFTCANYSPTPDKHGVHTPLVNISGRLIDYTGQSHPVEWITIDGAYEDISIFQEPPTTDINPNIATTKLQLASVQRITTMGPDSSAHIAQPVKYAGRDYLKIYVYTHGTSSGAPYLIDKTAHVICQARPAQSGQRHEFSFEAIKELIIDAVSVPSREPRTTTSHHANLAREETDTSYTTQFYNAAAQSIQTFLDGVTSMAHYLWV